MKLENHVCLARSHDLRVVFLAIQLGIFGIPK